MSNTKKIIKGMVIKAKGKPDPNHYIIQELDETGGKKKDKTYIAHVGDLLLNTELLYQLAEIGMITTLKEGDIVEFELGSPDHGINVKAA